MNFIQESSIAAFYSHALQVEHQCDLQCPSEKLMKLCNDILSCLIEVECQDIIQVIKKTGICFNISSGDIPQFSKLDDCVYKVPLLVRDCGIEHISYAQLGFMLRTKPRKVIADLKYGENHSKTAAQMGLCTIIKARVYPTYLGLAFCDLDKEKQKNLLPKLILFIPFILNQFSLSAKYEDVVGSISILSESTQKRRLSNIWNLIKQVNKVLPYELQIIRY